MWTRKSMRQEPGKGWKARRSWTASLLHTFCRKQWVTGGQRQSVPSYVHWEGQGAATADSNCGPPLWLFFHREAPRQPVIQHLNRGKHTSTLTCIRFRKTPGKKRKREIWDQIFMSGRKVQIFTWNKTGLPRVVLNLSLKKWCIIKFTTQIFSF